ncbi:MAG: glycerate kinase, partial [Klebsiella michiganensis]|nr:glycerate kinase [Klebsiella michiganensis]
MKIVIAPDSYKESLSATEVAQAIEKGFREIFPDALYVKVPLADGGEGTVEAMIAATQGTEMSACVTGPLGVPVNACWGLSGDGKTAFIEMAAASGLGLVPPAQRNPLLTTSRGTGGMVQALGARLCDANGVEIGNGGGSLCSLNSIDLSGLDARLHDCAIRVACDVTNPLTGDTGASRIFGPQKGATEAMIRELDSNLAHYADVIKADLHVDVKQVAGAGAAGGMGAALMAFLNAELRSGIEIVTQALNLEEHILDCSLV